MSRMARQTFAAYMEQSLYGPDGYYASGRARSGRGGDYFTAADAGPAFGVLLGALFRQWAQAFSVQPFHLVELGAGSGKLARLLSDAHAPWLYTAVERSPARRRNIPGRVYAAIQDLPECPLTGIVFANELVDAFPVHRVRLRGGRIEEGFVEAGQWCWDEPSTPELARYFTRLGIGLPEGYETEVNLAMGLWMRSMAEALASGFLVLIDYGRPAWQYYAPERSGGTLRGFRGHEVRRDVLSPEMADLTADVEFTSLALDARDAGFEVLAFMEMGSFLMLGARALLEQDAKAKAPAGMRYLLHPEGMGSAFHVLVLGKGLHTEDWVFEGNRMSRLRLPPSPDDARASSPSP